MNQSSHAGLGCTSVATGGYESPEGSYLKIKEIVTCWLDHKLEKQVKFTTNLLVQPIYFRVSPLGKAFVLCFLLLLWTFECTEDVVILIAEAFMDHMICFSD